MNDEFFPAMPIPNAAIVLVAEETSDRIATLDVVTIVAISSHLPHYQPPFMPTIISTILDGVLPPMLRLVDRLKNPVIVPTRTQYPLHGSSVPLDMSRIYSAVPVDSRMADALFREVPEGDEEDEDEEEQGEDEEEDEDEDEDEGYSE